MSKYTIKSTYLENPKHVLIFVTEAVFYKDFQNIVQMKFKKVV